jgi:hypothetical protein
VLEEPDVERRVVRHQHGAAGELQEAGQHLGDARGVHHHLVGDAGQHRDEGGDQLIGVDERLELAQHLTAADLDGPDLGDLRALRCRAPRRLEVDDTEGDIGQMTAQLVE